MDPALRRHIKATMPQFNPLIAEGFAVSQIPMTEKYVDMLFSSIAESFPPGLTYEGGRRCTPREEYLEATRKRNQKPTRKNQKATFDIARSDVYMMQYHFKYNGIDLKPRYMSLPFVSDGGFITIGDSRYTISPVLADRVISVMRKTIFIRLIKTRFNVNRLMHHYVMDDEERSVHVAWSKVYQKKIIRDKSDPENVTAESTLAHYLFCKMGVSETFRQFAKCTPVFGTSGDITVENYPQAEWHIARTTRNAQNGAPTGRRALNYTATDLRVAIRKSEMSPMAEKLLAGFFYVADYFPSNVAHLPGSINSKHELTMWILVLGRINTPGPTAVGKILKEMEDHIRSLDEYIDPIVRGQLENIGFSVTNVYQLFALLIDNFNVMLLANANKLSSMYEKELNVLYFVLFDISKQIIELGFRMLKMTEKDVMTVDKINHVFGNHIRPGAIFHIYKNSGAVSANSYPGDNKVLKITTLLVPQQHTNKKNKKKGGLQLNDPINRLHVSVAEVGGYANLPKSQPSGHFRISPFLQLTSDNVVVQAPWFIPLANEIQAQLEMQMNNIAG